MPLEHDLAIGLLASHPFAAARLLEGLPPDGTARFFEVTDPAAVAGCLQAMLAPAAAQVLASLEPERAARVVERLPSEVAGTCLRRLDSELRERLLTRLDRGRARSLRSLLRFQPNTAGALMDPDVLALPVDLTVGEATDRVREAAHSARYNLYAVDDRQRLVGAFNLRELFLADPRAVLSSIARPNPHRLPASADRQAIVSHAGWREVHALPVVDPGGLYLGAIRYRALRRIEEELRGGRAELGATARALGDLFRTGASSVLEAVAAAGSADEGRRANASS